MSADQNETSNISGQDSSSPQNTARFCVIDTRLGPHGGLILKLRFDFGTLPKIRKLRNGTLTAIGPESQRPLELIVAGFPLFAGKQSIDRLYRTGRIDLNVISPVDELSHIRPGWKIIVDLK